MRTIDNRAAAWFIAVALFSLCLWATSGPAAGAADYDATGPIASGHSAEPSINGPRVVGSTPGRPFLFLVPVTGEGPFTFSAISLPQGLRLDPRTGIITGSLLRDGTWTTKIIVTSSHGKVSRNLNIVGGRGKLALTPPMGWNSWNVWGVSVNDKQVRSAADAMALSGLASAGFQYVNIDDGWEGERDEDGTILTNDKFPDMNALSDYVHAKGLKLGIYSSPGPYTCQHLEGSYGHELQDAETFAEWGIDYLKYDWCYYTQKVTGIRLKDFKKPYVEMGEILIDDIDRDIVYSICQYGMRDVWKWGEEVGGNLWRTTGDIRDTWKSMSKIGFSQNGLEKYAGSGHWNDPDMLVVGKVGWGPTLHESRLTEDEQVTHITLWSILASPLLIGCDMADMDEFTVDVLTNEEVVEINQDPLGKQGYRRSKRGKLEVWARPLWDSTLAVALFNRSEREAEVEAKFSDLGLSGSQPVRDLWRKKDVGEFDDSFSATIPAHGAALLKIGAPDEEDFSL